MRTIFALPAVLLHILLSTPTAAHPSLPHLSPEIDPLTLRSLYADTPSNDIQARAHPSGQMILASQNQEIPLSFTVSRGACKPLQDEINCLVADLSSIVLDSNSGGISPEPGCHDGTARVSESAGMFMSSHEYRATVELAVTGSISKRELENLVSLLGKTVSVIGDEREKMGMERGAGSMVIEMTIGGVGVHVTWTFYEVVGGVAVEC